MGISKNAPNTGDATLRINSEPSCQPPTLSVERNPYSVLKSSDQLLAQTSIGGQTPSDLDLRIEEQTVAANERIKFHNKNKRVQKTGFPISNNRCRTNGEDPPASPPRLFTFDNRHKKFQQVGRLDQDQMEDVLNKKVRNKETSDVTLNPEAQQYAKNIVFNKINDGLDGKRIVISTCEEPIYPRAKIDYVANQILNDIWGKQGYVTGKTLSYLKDESKDVVLDGSRQTYNLTIAITEKRNATNGTAKTVWIAANLTDMEGENEHIARLMQENHSIEREQFFRNEVAATLRKAQVVEPQEAFDLVFLPANQGEHNLHSNGVRLIIAPSRK